MNPAILLAAFPSQPAYFGLALVEIVLCVLILRAVVATVWFYVTGCRLPRDDSPQRPIHPQTTLPHADAADSHWHDHETPRTLPLANPLDRRQEPFTPKESGKRWRDRKSGGQC